ncbi:MAG: hypothetical protein GXO33_08065 [Epsilonproteobacteria bacterium]|nr:hypothetical protein [Campylobacterota bacterium]
MSNPLCKTFSATFLALVVSAGAAPWTFEDAVKKSYDAKAYDWNALNTRWINMRAVGLLGLDAALFGQNGKSIRQVGDMGRYERWDVRGLRLGAAGTINFDHPWIYLFSISVNSVMQDYDSDTQDAISVLDASVSLPLSKYHGRLRIGKMKEPDGMSRMMGLVFEQVMERPMHVDAFTPTRADGILYSDLLAEGEMTLRLGVFNDWLEKGQKGFAHSDTRYVARISGVAYESPLKEELWHLGAAYRYNDAASGSVRYKVGPEFSFCDPWLDTGDIPAHSATLLNLESSWLAGPWWLDAEYSVQEVDARTARYRFEGWHASINWFVTGEHRGYNRLRGAVRRVRPLRPVTEGGWGALELSARYSYLDLRDNGIEGGKMGITSLGAIWHPTRQTQFHLQYSRVRLQGPVPAAGIDDGTSRTDIFQFRFVLLID